MLVFEFSMFWKMTIPATILYSALIWRIQKQEALAQ